MNIAHKWLELDRLTAHPHNMRSGDPESLEVFAQDMRENGYRIEKPMLVRPHGDGYQIIGGHTRLKAAKLAEIESVFCVIEKMDDDQAVLRLARDNQNDKPAWFDVCLYVARNAVKSSKTGLSRTALVSAATGKVGDVAKVEARWLGNAGEALDVSKHVFTLLSRDEPKTRHLAEIHKLPKSTWPLVADHVLREGLTVKHVQATVKSIHDMLQGVPKWWGLDVQAFASMALKDARVAKVRADAMAKAGELCAELGTVALFKHTDTGKTVIQGGAEYRVMAPSSIEYDQRARFKADVKDLESINSRMVSDAYTKILEYSAEHSNGQQELVPVLTAKEQAAKDAHDEQAAKEASRLAKAAQIHHGDCLPWLDGWDKGPVRLLLSDPPYGMAFQSNRRTASSKADAIQSDASYETAMKLIADMLDRAVPHLADDAHVILFCSDNGAFQLRKVMEDAGLTFKRILVWVKPNHTSGDLKGSFAPRKELAIHAVKGSPTVSPRRDDVYIQESAEKDTDHPTEKPVSLLRSWIECTTDAGDIVLDPFAGTGATIVAAESDGRIGYGAEMDEGYQETAVARLMGVQP